MMHLEPQGLTVSRFIAGLLIKMHMNSKENIAFVLRIIYLI